MSDLFGNHIVGFPMRRLIYGLGNHLKMLHPLGDLLYYVTMNICHRMAGMTKCWPDNTEGQTR